MKIDFEFACRDDCLSKMVPSDLRMLVCERDDAVKELEKMKASLKYVSKQVSRLFIETATLFPYVINEEIK